VQRSVASLGEPMICGFDPRQLAMDLQMCGLRLVEDLSGAELQTRYCARRADALTVMPTNHVARARSLD
jgi:hypothetical protein